jgi:methyl-accepting chemotaxis protein
MVEDQQKSVNEQTRLMQTNNQIFTEVSHVAIQVEAAANQIAAGSQSLAQATTEQASVVEQINASIKEITAQSKGNADNSRRANTLVSSANDSAMQGAAKMEEMTVAMNDDRKFAKRTFYRFSFNSFLRNWTSSLLHSSLLYLAFS